MRVSLGWYCRQEEHAGTVNKQPLSTVLHALPCVHVWYVRVVCVCACVRACACEVCCVVCMLVQM